MVMKGVIVSSGYSFGRVFILNEEKIDLNCNKISFEQIDSEISLFVKSHIKTVKQLKNIRKKIKKDKDKKLLFDGYLMLLEDNDLKQDIISNIKQKLMYSDNATNEVIQKYIDSMKNIKNLYLQDRIVDILDIGKRLIYNIKNLDFVDFSFSDVKHKIIIVAKDLLPSQVIQFNLKKVVGFVTELGSLTSHTSIIAKSLNLPAIIKVKNIINMVSNNDNLIIDGVENNVYINPDKDVLISLKDKHDSFVFKRKQLIKLKNLPAITVDGFKIKLFANIANNNDIKFLIKNNVKGVGLYRTEFLFMDRNSFPSEEEQFLSYKKIAMLMKGNPVTIRTVDLGGDKFLPYMNFPKEEISCLGWRAIRICMDRKDILYNQLRAILRASIYGKLRIMFPMIISMEEVFFLKKEIKKLKLQLTEEKCKFDDNIEIGAMIETPAAAIISKHLSKELDFFSIGTNDLTQYTLAVDRNNSMISHLYEPLSPSIIYLIKYIVDSVNEYGKKLSICGELASDERAIMLLLGLGVKELSMSVSDIPKVKQIICKNSLSFAKEISKEVLSKSTVNEVLTVLNRVK